MNHSEAKQKLSIPALGLLLHLHIKYCYYALLYKGSGIAGIKRCIAAPTLQYIVQLNLTACACMHGIIAARV